MTCLISELFYAPFSALGSWGEKFLQIIKESKRVSFSEDLAVFMTHCTGEREKPKSRPFLKSPSNV